MLCSKTRRIVSIFVGLFLCTQQAFAAFSGEVSLLLMQGMSTSDARIELICRNDVWDTTAAVYASGSYSLSGLSPGRISDLSLSSDTIMFAAATPETNSSWNVKACIGKNQATGTYKGTFMGQAVAGSVQVTVKPAPAGIPSLSSGEHPRLFFRRSDIPRLQQYAATPWGKDILDEMKKHGSYSGGYFHGEVAAGFAFRYLITRDPSDLKSARAWLIRAFNDKSSEHGAHGNKDKVAYAAIAYDLLYQDLPPAERDAFRYMLVHWALNYNAKDCTSPFTAGFMGAGGLASLAILDDPATLGPRPVSPEMGRSIPAAAGHVPPAGVPVEEFVSGKMPVNWIYAAAYAPDENQDPLASLGGCANARPVPGSSITCKGRTDQFEAISHPMNIYNQSMYALPGIPPADPAFTLYKLPKTTKISGIAGGARPSATEYDGQISYYYCYTVLRVNEGFSVKANPNSDGTTYGLSMWLNGEQVRDGEVIRLEKGLYPLLVEMPVMGLWWAPRLSQYTSERYQFELSEWQRDSAAVSAARGKDPGARTGLLRCADLIKCYIRTNIGDRGFSNERMGSGEVMNEILPFVAAYRNVTGIELTSGLAARLDWVIPLAIATHGEEPPFHTQDAGQLTFWKTMGFPGLLPQQWRAAYKWQLENDGRWGLRNSGQGMFALLNYPQDVEAVHPKDAGLPKVIIDKVHWNLVAKSGYDDSRDVTTIVMLGQNQSTHLRAMEFVIQAFGDPSPVSGTVHGPEGYFTSPKLHEENTIRLTGAIPIDGARPLYMSSSDDGSCIVSAELDHFGKGRIWSTPSQVFGGIGGGVYIEDSTNLGVAAFRSIGIDYSGASGTPGLIAVVDRIRGAGSLDLRVQLRIPNSTIAGNAIKRTTGTGNILKATFIYPENLKLSAPAKGTFEARGDSLFFYVLTIGSEPSLQVSGSGAGKVVKAGNQTIWFDGNRVRFGVYNGKEQPVSTSDHNHEKRTLALKMCGIRVFDLQGRLLSNSQSASGRGTNRIDVRGRFRGARVWVYTEKGTGLKETRRIVKP